MGKCKDCKFYKGGEVKECWRQPPIVRSKNFGTGVFISVRPKVERDTECGEFVQKVE